MDKAGEFMDRYKLHFDGLSDQQKSFLEYYFSTYCKEVKSPLSRLTLLRLLTFLTLKEITDQEVAESYHIKEQELFQNSTLEYVKKVKI